MGRKAGGKRLVRKIKRKVAGEESRREKRMPNPFSSLAEKLCEVKPCFWDGLHRPDGDIVKIALVSMPDIGWEAKRLTSLKGSTLPPGVDPTACDRQLTIFQGDAPQRMFVAFEEALRVALEDLKANVVCFSELGLPTRSMKPMAEAKTLAYEMSQKHGALIVAGSGHDDRTLFNTGYLFHPGCPKDGLSFHKAISAFRVGEQISAPSQRSVPAVKMFGLSAVSMICLDIADYASIAAVVQVGDKVDLILVPCYNKRFDDMREIAVVASKALPGVVALVNFYRKGAQRCHVARFGELEETREQGLSSGGSISILDLNFDHFQKTRIELQNKRDGDLEYLFGRRYWFYPPS